MATIATIELLAADSWNITTGGGWIVLMLIGMGACFVFMIGSMWLMRDGGGWSMCGRRSPQKATRRELWTGTPVRSPGAVPPESEA